MKLFRLVAAFAAVLVTLSLQSRAATLVWTNTAGGIWSTAANWSPNASPAAADTTFITNSGTYTVTVNAGATIANLTVGDTNATGTQTLSITAGTFTITNVTSASNGVILLNAGILATSGSANLSGPVNHNTGTWQLNTPININTYNLTNGELRGANCIITNFNWLGGSLNSDALGTTTTIPVGGTLNISGATGKTLSYYVAPGRALINNGSATWSGAGITGQGGATIANNGTMTLNGDFAFNWGSSGANPVFNNNGTLTKASGAGAFTLTSIIVNNSNTMDIASGSLAFSSSQFHNRGAVNLNNGTVSFASSSGTNYGTLALGANSFADFNAGSTYTLDGVLTSPTGDHIRVQGATVTLITTNITTPSLLIASGQLTQGTNNVVNTINHNTGTWQLNVPVAINNYNLTNGELRGANISITNFNWLGGSLNSDSFGSSVTVPSGGTLNISGATGKALSAYVGTGRSLNNNGTAAWSGAGITGYYGAQFNNNGSLTLNGDFSYTFGGVGASSVFNNNGTLTKASGSGAFTLSSSIFNNNASGSANISSGSLTFNSSQFHNFGATTISGGTIGFNSASGTNWGTLDLAASSFADFNAGSSYTLSGIVNSPSGDHVRVQGATVTLLTTNLTTPSLLIASGQLTQGTNNVVNTINQNVGTWQLNVPTTINNYNLTNGELRGANVIITNFNWFGGSLNSDSFGNSVTVPNGGTLNISSSTAKALSAYVGNGRTLLNNGTATWSGAGITGYYGPQLVNNGNMTITGDFSYVWGGAGSGPYLINYTTLNLASGSDLTLNTVNYYNAPGAGIYFNTGSITFTGCAGTNAGLLNLDATSFVNFDSGSLRLDGNLISPAGDRLRFRGMTVDLVTTNITTPSLLLSAGLLNQNTNVAVNTMNQNVGTWQLNVPTVINNYNLTNGELRGVNNTISNFNWYGGSLNSDALGNITTIAPGGTLNISSPTAKGMSYYVAPGRTLINNGTAVWSGAGITGQDRATFANNGTLTMAGDFSLVWGGAGGGPILRNYTTLILSNGSDFTLSSATLDNQAGAGIYFSNGSITVGSGSVATNSGLLNLDATSFFQFSGATLSLGGAVVAPTGNSLRLAGTTAYIVTTNLSTPSLWQQAGTVVQNTNVIVNTYNQQAGTFLATLPVAFNNFNMTNAEIRGADVTITNFNWLGGGLNADGPGSDTITIPAGGTLNISGATAKGLSYYTAPGRTLINNGTAVWSGAGITGQDKATILNNAAMTLAGDFSLVWGGAGSGPVLRNTSSLTLSNGSDFTLTSAYFDNQSSGTISFTNGSITVGSGSIGTNNGVLNLDVTSFFLFSGATLNLGGTVIAPANNSLRFAGTTAYVVTTNINSPSFWQQGGTLVQMTNIVVNSFNQQAGTLYGTLPLAFNNYNMTNAELRGANVTITNFNWLGGSLNGENAGSNTVTIPAGGTLNISGATAKAIGDYSAANNGRRLINNGTGNWSGAGITGYYFGGLVNQATLDLAGDFSLAWGGAGNGPLLLNTGTINLTSGADFSMSSVNFDNRSNGVINAVSGSLTVGPGSVGTNSGSLNLDTSSYFQFSGATMYFGGTAVSPGNNNLRFGGTTAYITTPNITAPSIWQQAGTIYQLTNFVVNTFNQQAGTLYGALPLAFNNYNMTNAELRGANVTITNFNWLGGTLNSENSGSNTVTIPAGGTLNISGATGKNIGDYSATTNGRRLVNRGAGIWSGAGITAYWSTIISNIGTLNVTNDTSLVWGGGGGGPVLLNSGTFTKSGGTGALNFSSAIITNSGTFNINSGNFALSGGDFTQTSGSANLGTNFSCGANARVLAGTFVGRGSIGGTFFNNGLSSAGAPLGLITGTSWTNSATGTIRFELGGTNPGTNFDQFRLTGPATVNGTADLALLNGFVPVPGNTFTCIVATARSGVFTNLTFSGGYEFSALYTPTTVVFRAENALPTVNLSVLNGNTQLVCTPFKLLATASDVGGAITNLSILQDGITIANANSGSTTATGESDFPLDVTFIAQAIDDQGGKSWATQTVSLTTSPLHVLQLGGKRTNGVFKFCMAGETGSNYMVLATTNVAEVQTNWTPLGLMENTNGIWRYYDNGTMTNRPYRFYRAWQQ